MLVYQRLFFDGSLFWLLAFDRTWACAAQTKELVPRKSNCCLVRQGVTPSGDTW